MNSFEVLWKIHNNREEFSTWSSKLVQNAKKREVLIEILGLKIAWICGETTSLSVFLFSGEEKRSKDICFTLHFLYKCQLEYIFLNALKMVLSFVVKIKLTETDRLSLKSVLCGHWVMLDSEIMLNSIV